MPASRLVFEVTAATSTASATSPLLPASAHVALSAIVAPLAGPAVLLLSFGVEIVAFGLVMIDPLAVGTGFDGMGDHTRVASMGPWLNVDFSITARDWHQRTLRSMLVRPCCQGYQRLSCRRYSRIISGVERTSDSVVQGRFGRTLIPEGIMVLVIRLNIGAVGWEQSGVETIDLVVLIKDQSL